MSRFSSLPSQHDVPLVLIVEDESIAALDLQSWLRFSDMPCASVIAASGEEALALAAAVGPDAAVMNVQLDGSLDGIDTARRLWQGFRVLSVFVSGLGPAAVSRRLAGLEHAGVLTKPVNKDRLSEGLRRALEARQRWLSHEANRQGILRFFLVGDASGDTARHLVDLGHEVERADDLEAIGEPLCRSNRAEDVLLVDLPEVEGSSIAGDLRSLHRRCPRVPTVLRTAGAALPARDAALSGVCAYLRSPLDLNELSTVVLRLQDRRVNESMRDGLTGLYRRASFAALARQQLRTARRLGTRLCLVRADLGEPGADIDRIESRLGLLGTLMQSTFRDADITGRINGTDCGVVLVNADRDTTQIAIERLRRRIDEHNASAGEDGALRVDIGLADFDPESPRSFEELVAAAMARAPS